MESSPTGKLVSGSLAFISAAWVDPGWNSSRGWVVARAQNSQAVDQSSRLKQL